MTDHPWSIIQPAHRRIRERGGTRGAAPFHRDPNKASVRIPRAVNCAREAVSMVQPARATERRPAEIGEYRPTTRGPHVA